MNSKVDAYIHNTENWRKEILQLRKICLDCGLTEVLKWHQPCYSYQSGNIVIIQAFKEACMLMFFKGSLLKDPEGILEKPGKSSRIARRIPFTSVQEIAEMEPVLRLYIHEAIEAEKAGLKVKPKKKEIPIPDELQEQLDENPDFKKAFEALTPGRQRGYLLHFSDAKQSKTRKRRVKKYIPHILQGKGLHDR